MSDDQPTEEELEDAWQHTQAHAAHLFLAQGMSFIEAHLCPDIRYDAEIAKVMCAEVYPEIEALADTFVTRLAARVDTLAELHRISHES